MTPDRRARRAQEFRPHRVVVLAMDGVLPFELGIPHRIFGRPRDAEGRLLYEVLTCSIRPPGPVRTDADFAIQVEHGPEILATADTVIVPASYELGPVFEQGVLTDELAAALAHIRPPPPRHPARLHLPRRLRPGRRPPARRPPGHHALGRLRPSPATLPAGQGRPGSPVHRRR